MRHSIPAVIFGCLIGAAGCSPPKPPVAELPPPAVSVAKPITDRSERDYAEFISTLDAAESIDVRSRVTGYLTDIAFTPGQAVVKNETLLFVIDRRPFAAALRKAEGDVKVAEANLKLAKSLLAQTVAAMAASKGSVSQADKDKDTAQVEVSQAQLEALMAARDQAKINLDFTEIKAEVDGFVGRNLITKGNLVTADMTLLTTIVKPDPIYAYFDVDQRTVERYRQNNDVKRGDTKHGDTVDVELGLEEDKGAFPYMGKVNFADVKLNPNTGALQVRGIFWNKDLKKGQKALESGYTARVRVAVSPEFKPILIPDRAVGTDQQQKFVYVVTADNKVQYRKVTLGSLYADSLRAVVSGLDGDELVIVNGLQRVRPGISVDPEEVDPITERPLKPAALKKKK